MKRRIIRIMMICMLIGFCISPSILKSQLVQPSNSASFLFESDMQYTINFNNWFSLDHLFGFDWSSEENEKAEAGSLKNKLDVESKIKSPKDSTVLKVNRSPLKNFRNKPVIIQTRI